MFRAAACAFFGPKAVAAVGERDRVPGGEQRRGAAPCKYGDGAAPHLGPQSEPAVLRKLIRAARKGSAIVLVARDHTFRAGELHRIPQEKIDAQHRVGALAALRRLCGAQQKPRAPVRSQLLILISACVPRNRRHRPRPTGFCRKARPAGPAFRRGAKTLLPFCAPPAAPGAFRPVCRSASAHARPALKKRRTAKACPGTPPAPGRSHPAPRLHRPAAGRPRTSHTLHTRPPGPPKAYTAPGLPLQQHAAICPGGSALAAKHRRKRAVHRNFCSAARLRKPNLPPRHIRTRSGRPREKYPSRAGCSPAAASASSCRAVVDPQRQLLCSLLHPKAVEGLKAVTVWKGAFSRVFVPSASVFCSRTQCRAAKKQTRTGGSPPVLAA